MQKKKPINAMIPPTSLNVHSNMAFHRTLAYQATHPADDQHAQ